MIWSYIINNNKKNYLTLKLDQNLLYSVWILNCHLSLDNKKNDLTGKVPLFKIIIIRPTYLFMINSAKKESKQTAEILIHKVTFKHVLT